MEGDIVLAVLESWNFLYTDPAAFDLPVSPSWVLGFPVYDGMLEPLTQSLVL